ncbi:unnamed protein product [Musa acuminata subsp. malaccensis]|uniref:(wild Malaysian banana) hypothetical protein n=1 Tax=Musa acuminata subsp. malaccensis TaxID=214687 RepID=A0A804J0V9_MUSAM|nr:unnamed protein product [Musa acuminata subsp. malaccensis]
MQDPDPARVHGPRLPRWPAPPARSSPGLPPSKSAHRDIKPTSLLIDSGRRVKIADFTDNGPLRLLRRYHRLNEPRADRHRPQPQDLRRLRRQHLELRPQNPILGVVARQLPVRREPRSACRLSIAHVRHLLRRSAGGAAHPLR